MDEEKKVAIKFLVSNVQAGILIGSGGKSITELSELVPGARINVSGQRDVYPGTNDRIVLISGDLDSVLQAQILVWELLTILQQQGSREEIRSVAWSPKAAAENLGNSSGLQVSAKVTIPAAAGGAILGKGGANMKQIVEDSGARVNMAGKDEALLTQERVISISGEASECVRATNMIVSMLHSQEKETPFVNRGTSYGTPTGAGMGRYSGEGSGARTYTGGARRSGGGGSDGSRGDDRNRGRDVGEDAEDSTAVQSTITLSVPNDLVGNIMGRNGNTLREIIALSGAKVVVSKRGEYTPGTNNRVVTITGSAAQTQSAHVYVTKRLETPANSPPPAAGRGRGRGGDDYKA